MGLTNMQTVFKYTIDWIYECAVESAFYKQNDDNNQNVFWCVHNMHVWRPLADKEWLNTEKKERTRNALAS